MPYFKKIAMCTLAAGAALSFAVSAAEAHGMHSGMGMGMGGMSKHMGAMSMMKSGPKHFHHFGHDYLFLGNSGSDCSCYYKKYHLFSKLHFLKHGCLL